ncbi:uncharacterized protein LOC107975205 [Pan troglodytes]|uniref:uncharacterized protein LOC107975205 n=1 Tax=Pan troglodytes TaxID=9598 RepID=UPI0023F2BD24|nr:uncharacterized protein LOC107975205 [Pan troglodytes]
MSPLNNTEFVSRQLVSRADTFPQAISLPTENARRAFRFHASPPATVSSPRTPARKSQEWIPGTKNVHRALDAAASTPIFYIVLEVLTAETNGNESTLGRRITGSLSCVNVTWKCDFRRKNQVENPDGESKF